MRHVEGKRRLVFCLTFSMRYHGVHEGALSYYFIGVLYNVRFPQILLQNEATGSERSL